MRILLVLRDESMTQKELTDQTAKAEEAGIRGKVKIMVGGAPVTAAFAGEIRADAYTPDAASAAKKTKELVA